MSMNEIDITQEIKHIKNIMTHISWSRISVSRFKYVKSCVLMNRWRWIMSVMMMMMSQCSLMFLWSFCVKASPDLSSFNINPSAPVITTNTATPVTPHSSPQTESTSSSSSINCTFDPCVDLQMTFRCSDVTSDALERPLSVDVQALTHSLARVQWCAHYSPALDYLLVFSRDGLTQKTLRLSSAVRQVFVSELTAEHTHHVCVYALQEKNTSAPRCASVVMDVNTELYMYILIVICVILTLTVTTQTFCLIKLYRKQPASNQTHLHS